MENPHLLPVLKIRTASTLEDITTQFCLYFIMSSQWPLKLWGRIRIIIIISTVHCDTPVSEGYIMSIYLTFVIYMHSKCGVSQLIVISGNVQKLQKYKSSLCRHINNILKQHTQVELGSMMVEMCNSVKILHQHKILVKQCCNLLQ